MLGISNADWQPVELLKVGKHGSWQAVQNRVQVSAGLEFIINQENGRMKKMYIYAQSQFSTYKICTEDLSKMYYFQPRPTPALPGYHEQCSNPDMLASCDLTPAGHVAEQLCETGVSH